MIFCVIGQRPESVILKIVARYQLLFAQLCALAALRVRMFMALNIGFAPLRRQLEWANPVVASTVR